MQTHHLHELDLKISNPSRRLQGNVMASEKLTEYERRRLENIRRNDEMMAALKLRSKAALLSSSSKRQKTDSKMKSYKEKVEKAPPSETPVVIRRSLRTRGMPPDCGVLADDVLDEKFIRGQKRVAHDKLVSKVRIRGPISMRNAYSGFDSGNELLVRAILGFSKENCGGSPMKKETEELEEHNRGILGASFSEGGHGNLRCKLEDNGTKFKGGIVDNYVDGENLDVNADRVEGFMEGIIGESAVAKNLSMPIGRLEDWADKCNKGIPSDLGESDRKGEVDRRNLVDSKFENLAFSECKEKIKSEIVMGEGGKFGECNGENESEISASIGEFSLVEENIARVVPGRILTVRFFPTNNLRMVAVGNKFGNIGFWNMNAHDEEGKGNGIYLYHVHFGPVSGISIHPFNLSKMFTCCYDGFIRSMDVEKQVFDLVYASDETVFSLCQSPIDDAQCLFFGEGPGALNMWDMRVGKSLSSWLLHEDRINTIDFCSRDRHLLATSSSDATACIWDLRMMGKCVRTVDHGKAVHAAYFSPSGGYLATTSIDNTLSIVSGHTFQNTSVVPHNNRTGRWISSFRAIWGWNDSGIFIGNMKRGVDIISPTRNSIVTTLTSPHMSAIPCRFSVHPCEVGTLAGATSGGQVYVWTTS